MGGLEIFFFFLKALFSLTRSMLKFGTAQLNFGRLSVFSPLWLDFGYSGPLGGP
jgi:hypothetical protein